MKHAHVVGRELPLFGVNSLSQSRTAEAVLALEVVRSNASATHEGVGPESGVSAVPAWRTRVPKWIRESEDHVPEPVLVSQDTMEQMKVWAEEMVEFRKAQASPEDLAADSMSEEERYLASIDLVKQLGLAQVRLKLSAGLYDSPLLYTVKGLDPWVDKQCTRLARKLFNMRSVYDPHKVMSAIEGFLWPFTQKGFKF